MGSKKNKIQSFRDILSRFRIPRFVAFLSCLNAMIQSSKESRVNFLFQFINFTLLVLLVFMVLPSRFDQWLSSLGEIEWAFLPIGRVVATIVSYFIFQTISWFFDFSPNDIFATSLKMTMWLLVGLLVLILFIFNKLVFAFKDRLKQDLILWQTNR